MKSLQRQQSIKERDPHAICISSLVEQESSGHVDYVTTLHQGSFNWQVRRRYTDFQRTFLSLSQFEHPDGASLPVFPKREELMQKLASRLSDASKKAFRRDRCQQLRGFLSEVLRDEHWSAQPCVQEVLAIDFVPTLAPPASVRIRPSGLGPGLVECTMVLDHSSSAASHVVIYAYRQDNESGEPISSAVELKPDGSIYQRMMRLRPGHCYNFVITTELRPVGLQSDGVCLTVQVPETMTQWWALPSTLANRARAYFVCEDDFAQNPSTLANRVHLSDREWWWLDKVGSVSRPSGASSIFADKEPYICSSVQVSPYRLSVPWAMEAAWDSSPAMGDTILPTALDTLLDTLDEGAPLESELVKASSTLFVEQGAERDDSGAAKMLRPYGRGVSMLSVASSMPGLEAPDGSMFDNFRDPRSSKDMQTSETSWSRYEANAISRELQKDCDVSTSILSGSLTPKSEMFLDDDFLLGSDYTGSDCGSKSSKRTIPTRTLDLVGVRRGSIAVDYVTNVNRSIQLAVQQNPVRFDELEGAEIVAPPVVFDQQSVERVAGIDMDIMRGETRYSQQLDEEKRVSRWIYFLTQNADCRKYRLSRSLLTGEVLLELVRSLIVASKWDVAIPKAAKIATEPAPQTELGIAIVSPFAKAHAIENISQFLHSAQFVFGVDHVELFAPLDLIGALDGSGNIVSVIKCLFALSRRLPKDYEGPHLEKRPKTAPRSAETSTEDKLSIDG